MDISTLLLIALILGALFYIIKGQMKKATPGRASDKEWSINWSYGFPTTPELKGKGWIIRFLDTRMSLHYVQKYKNLPVLKEGASITAMVEITGGPFAALEGGDPKISAMIQRKGDKMRENHYDYRWYSNTSIPLTPGQHVITWTLTTDNFGNVMGGRNKEAFRKALEEAVSFALVFGSAGGLGHGVITTVPGATVELLSLN